MKILKFTKTYWKIFGFYCDDNDSNSLRVLGHSLNFLTSFILSVMTIFSIAYLWMKDGLKAQDVAHILYLVVVASSSVVTNLVVIRKRNEFINLIKSLEMQVRKRLNEKNIQIYENAERKSDLTLIMPLTILMPFYFVIFPFIQFVYWMRDIARGEIDVSRWFNIYIMR